MNAMSDTQTPAPASATELTVDQALQQGIAHHKAGQLPEAERTYRAILQVQPQHPDANHNLGVLAVGVGQPTAALPFLKHALEANPAQGQYWLSYIDALIRVGEYQTAQQIIAIGRQKGLDGEPVRQLEQRVVAGRNQGQATSPADHEEALAHREAGRYKEAAAWLQAWLAEHPQDAAAYALLGQVCLLDKQDDAASTAIERASAIAPALPVVQRNRARLLLRQQKYEAALQTAQAVYQSEPQNPENELLLAVALGAGTQMDQALLLVDRVLKEYPEYAEAYASRAALRLRNNDPAGALADAEKALAIKPHLMHLWGMVGLLRHQFKNLAGAIQALQNVLANEPDNIEQRVNLGEMLRQNGQIEAAITLLQETVVRTPNQGGAWINLGTALQEAGRFD
jgi:tetratricopeptide (TPR) repeat protein